MRTFVLERDQDPGGVSGTGVVAQGCMFDDGSVALRWKGPNASTAVWPDLAGVERTHGHGGATRVVWTATGVPTTLPPGELSTRWRTGRRVLRTVYVQWGPVPADCGEDTLIGMMDTPELAQEVVRAHNALL